MTNITRFVLNELFGYRKDTLNSKLLSACDNVGHALKGIGLATAILYAGISAEDFSRFKEEIYASLAIFSTGIILKNGIHDNAVRLYHIRKPK